MDILNKCFNPRQASTNRPLELTKYVLSKRKKTHSIRSPSFAMRTPLRNIGRTSSKRIRADRAGGVIYAPFLGYKEERRKCGVLVFLFPQEELSGDCSLTPLELASLPRYDPDDPLPVHLHSVNESATPKSFLLSSSLHERASERPLSRVLHKARATSPLERSIKASIVFP